MSKRKKQPRTIGRRNHQKYDCGQCGGVQTMVISYGPLGNGQVAKTVECQKCGVRVVGKSGTVDSRTEVDNNLDGYRLNRKLRRHPDLKQKAIEAAKLNGPLLPERFLE